MPRVRILHWKPAEAAPLVEACRAAGHEAEYEDLRGSALSRAIRDSSPDAIAIDLSCLPSHGREVAVWLRGNKSTRHIPLVFVNGEAEKVARVKELLPDATFTTTGKIAAALRSACRKRATDPVVPPQMMDRYKTRTTAQKLGITAGSTVGVIDAPRDYPAALGALPEGVEVTEDPEEARSVTLWFVHDPEGLLAGLRRMRSMAHRTKLWILWRKGQKTGFTENVIREAALDAGLVDYKVCSVNERWSALAFARKKTA